MIINPVMMFSLETILNTVAILNQGTMVNPEVMFNLSQSFMFQTLRANSFQRRHNPVAMLKLAMILNPVAMLNLGTIFDLFFYHESQMISRLFALQEIPTWQF